MLYVVLFFLGFSLLLYVLLAGADFGAGIVELFSSKENQAITKKTVYRVMGPVWEANHIWIIIMIVILWVGLGITLRGIAFVFRHYDAYKDQSQIVYDWMFKISSIVTPIFLGICFGALLSGRIDLYAEGTTQDFKGLYIEGWLNGFSILVGLFFTALCAFLSSILLIGEAEAEHRKIYIKKALVATVAVVVIGFVTLSYGYAKNIPFVRVFVLNELSVLPVITSGFLLYPLWVSIKRGMRIYSRFFAGLQVLLILLAAVLPIFPNLILTTSTPINILETSAPQNVITVLGVTLIIGGCVILPGLFHLLKSFKMIKILEH